MNRSKQRKQSEPVSPRGWFQTEGLFHTSPGRRPGYTGVVIWLQANGLPHHVMNRAFSARQKFSGYLPRALPWAGMTDAFGVVDDGFGMVNDGPGVAGEPINHEPIGTPSVPSTFASSPLCAFALTLPRIPCIPRSILRSLCYLLFNHCRAFAPLRYSP